MKASSVMLLAAAFAAQTALAAPIKYTIDSDHTYPSFAADHMDGLSTWRGKFNKTSGTIVLDRDAQSGSLDVTVDMHSIDFGHDKLNDHAKSPEMFNADRYPTATFVGTLTNFVNGAPTTVDGALTLHGVTKPLRLKIDTFLCKPHPMTNKEVCGANASGVFNREDFGVSYGKQFGFQMNVDLNIQVEAKATPCRCLDDRGPPLAVNSPAQARGRF
jgi:polyisoprenoid-binding protein YceI